MSNGSPIAIAWLWSGLYPFSVRFLPSSILIGILLLPTPVLADSELAEKCQELGRNEQYRQAIDIVDKYLGQFPGDNNALFCRAGAKNALGDSQGALQDLQAAYKLDESRVDILRGIILVYQKLGEKSKMCRTWSILKYRNITAPRDYRFDLDTDFGRELQSVCTKY